MSARGTRLIKVFCLFLIASAIFLFLPGVVFASDSVVLNEVYIGNSTGLHQWVEIYNPTGGEIDLSGWIIDDAGSGSSSYQIDPGVKIGPGSFKSFQSNQFYFNYASADSVILKNSDGEVDRYDYSSSPGDSATLCRYPDGVSSWLICESTRDGNNISGENPPTSTPTPTSTPSPTSSPTPTSSPSTATYKINEVKDEDGNVLSNVKVYVDGEYVHHYAPETLTFCDGCQCDTYVDCDFGQHEIKLERSGYQDWNESETINSGDSYEVDPVMIVASSDSPTSTPTPSETPTPASISSFTPTPKPTGTRETPSPGEVLGEKEFYPLGATEEGEESEETASAGGKRKVLPFVFLGFGFVFLFGAGFYFWYTKIR